MKPGRTITIQELAEISAEEALNYDREFPVTHPDTELEALATVPETEPAIGVLLNNALKSGLSVEALQGMYALYEKDQRNKAEAALNAALSDFWRLCPKITRNRDSYHKAKDGTQLKYADLPHMLDIVRPVLTQCGLSASYNPTHGEGWIEQECIIRHVGGASISAKSLRFPLAKGADAGAVLQADGYARRNAFINASGLTSADEADASASPAKITADQVTILEGYLNETKDADGWRPRLLKFAGAPGPACASMDDIPATKFDECCRQMKERKGKYAPREEAPKS